MLCYFRRNIIPYDIYSMKLINYAIIVLIQFVEKKETTFLNIYISQEIPRPL